VDTKLSAQGCFLAKPVSLDLETSDQSLQSVVEFLRDNVNIVFDTPDLGPFVKEELQDEPVGMTLDLNDSDDGTWRDEL